MSKFISALCGIFSWSFLVVFSRGLFARSFFIIFFIVFSWSLYGMVFGHTNSPRQALHNLYRRIRKTMKKKKTMKKGKRPCRKTTRKDPRLNKTAP